jgi:hypothetical protein
MGRSNLVWDGGALAGSFVAASFFYLPRLGIYWPIERSISEAASKRVATCCFFLDLHFC